MHIKKVSCIKNIIGTMGVLFFILQSSPSLANIGKVCLLKSQRDASFTVNKLDATYFASYEAGMKYNDDHTYGVTFHLYKNKKSCLGVFLLWDGDLEAKEAVIDQGICNGDDVKFFVGDFLNTSYFDVGPIHNLFRFSGKMDTSGNLKGSLKQIKPKSNQTFIDIQSLIGSEANQVIFKKSVIDQDSQKYMLNRIKELKKVNTCIEKNKNKYDQIDYQLLLGSTLNSDSILSSEELLCSVQENSPIGLLRIKKHIPNVDSLTDGEVFFQKNIIEHIKQATKTSYLDHSKNKKSKDSFHQCLIKTFKNQSTDDASVIFELYYKALNELENEIKFSILNLWANKIFKDEKKCLQSETNNKCLFINQIYMSFTKGLSCQNNNQEKFWHNLCSNSSNMSFIQTLRKKLSQVKID